CLAEARNNARNGNDRIRLAEVAPGVTSRAAHDYFKAPAAQGLSNNRIGPAAIDNDRFVDAILPAGLFENMADAAQVALAFFTYVADEQDVAFGTNLRLTHRHGYRKQGDQSGGVVADSGPADALALFVNLNFRFRWKHGIEMRTDGGDWKLPMDARKNAEHVADFVDRDLFQSNRGELLLKPFRAFSLFERRSRNPCHFELHIAQLVLMNLEPRKRCMHGTHRGEQRNLLRYSDFFGGAAGRIHAINLPWPPLDVCLRGCTREFPALAEYDLIV